MRCRAMRARPAKWKQVGCAVDRFYSQQNIQLYRKLFDRATDEPHRRLLFDVLAAQARSMAESEPVRVHVERRGDKYVWELRRTGHFRPVKFSAPLYSSEEEARASGNEVRKSFLARSATRPPRAKRCASAAGARQKPISPPTNPHPPLNQAPPQSQTLENP